MTTRIAHLTALLALLVGLIAGAVGFTRLAGLDAAQPAAPATTEVRLLPLPPTPPRPAAPRPQRRVAVPTRIEVPAIDVDERLEGRGLRADGAFDTPDFGDAAWYDAGPRPGEPGGAVVVAHVHGPDGPDVFWELASLRPGAVVRVHRADGMVAIFVVDEVEDVPKERLPYDRIWPRTTAPLLRLITCGGTRTAAGYPENTVVFAHLAGLVPSSR